MLANHTSIADLFAKIVGQYEKMSKSGAYLKNYTSQEIFSDSLQEFDDSRNVVKDVIR